ncbi:MAG: DUF4957 domain-containing protein [Bacteroidales bacterium]|nr:DUF4957 domain-containing protein [Bacteroidales bacterium]
MKKLFLSLVSAMFAFAAFADSLVQEGDYLIVNNETGYYLAGGLSWGTQACLSSKPQFFTLGLVAETEDTYTLDSHQSNGGDNHFLGTGLFVDAAAANWTFAKAEDGTYTIANGGKYLSGNGKNSPVVLNDAASAASSWKLVTNADVVASQATATATAPVDVTAFIMDPQLKRNGNTSGYWKITSFDGTANANNFSQGQNGNIASCAESYHSTNGFKAVQKIAVSKKGVYSLSASAFYRQDGSDEDNLPYLFAGEQKSVFPKLTGSENNMVSAYASFVAGNYGVSPIYFATEEGDSIEIGLANANVSMWNIFGELTLKYYGEGSIADIKAASILADYQAVTGKVMEAAVSEAMETAKTTYDADPTDANLAAFSAAVANAKASVASYASAAEKLAAIKAFVAATNFYTSAAYEEYYGQYATKYEARTLTAAEASALQDPNTVTGWHAAITVDNFLLSVWDTNPDFTDAPYYINSWSTEGNNDGSGFKVPFFEYWTGDGESLGEKTLTATIEGLEANAKVQVSAIVRVRVKNGVTDPAAGITFQAGEGEAVSATAGAQVGTSQFYLDTIAAVGSTDAEGKLVAKFIVAVENNISWLSFKNVNYVLAGDPAALVEAVAKAQAITLTDAANKAALDAAIADAQAVAGKVATQAEYDAALAALNAAITLAEKHARAEAYEFGKYAYYSWESPEGVVCTKGGTLTTGASNTNRVNYANAGYYTICLNGKSDALTDNFVLLTLDEGLTFQAGDVIRISAYINKDSSKKSSAWYFYETEATQESAVYGDEANVYESFNGQVTTTEVVVPAEAAGSKTLKMTRKATGTNLFITKLEILRLPTDIEISPAEGDITAALAAASEGKIVDNIIINLTAGVTYTVSGSIVAPAGLTINGNGATIDASALEAALITTPAGDLAEWATAELAIKEVTLKGVKKGVYASAGKNYLYKYFAVENSVIEIAATSGLEFDFRKGGVAENFTISNSTIYAPEATTNSLYTSQSGQKATEAGDIVQTFTISNSTLYNLAKSKNFFTHRQSNQTWLAYNIDNSLFLNVGKSGQVVKGINQGQSGKNPLWNISGNAFNFEDADTSVAEDTGDAEEPVQNSVAGVVEFTNAAEGDFNGTFKLAEGATAPETLGDPRWNITFDVYTGISNLVAPAQNAAAIYDLQGRKVETLKKGQVYIQNGKKFVK